MIKHKHLLIEGIFIKMSFYKSSLKILTIISLIYLIQILQKTLNLKCFESVRLKLLLK